MQMFNYKKKTRKERERQRKEEEIKHSSKVLGEA